MIELTRYFCISAARLSDVIGSALDGDLRLFKYRQKQRGLRGFLVERKALETRFPIIDRGYAIISELAKCPYFTVKYLKASLRLGLLPSTPHPRGKGTLVSREALIKLHKDYVSSKELGSIYDVASRTISTELKETPASVASGAGVWRRVIALAILDRRFARV
jgi:hypothetical protein